MILEDVAEYLQEQGIGRVGQDIFVHHMPEIEQGILLMNPLVGQKIDHNYIDWRKGYFKIVVRATNYNDGFDLMKLISSELTLLDHEFANTTAKYIRPRTEPIIFPVSEGDVLEITVNYDTVYIVK